MKIHFMAAVDGNKEDYKRIIDSIEQLNHEIITRHYLERSIREIINESPSDSELYARKVLRWIKKADVIVYETTKPDVSVGYELALAVNLMKPVIVLYNEQVGVPPHSLKGVDSEKIQVIGYKADNLSEIIDLSLEHAIDVSDVRFNFFISPTIGQYLDWISKNKKIPRSVYLRNLIEKDMEQNEEYT
ncbi:MAG: hypothetical protein WAU07_02955 [Microgenomates group bacterium]